MTLRTIFFGTPEFAVPALRALHEVSQVTGVVCQPDRRAGRGMKWSSPAVKRAAHELGLPVYQPERVRSGELERWVRERGADAALVAAYGRILPGGVLAAPRRGCLNLHASILPEYRGAAPIQRAVLDGREETGISLMQMDEGMDTGPVYAVRRLAIPPGMNCGELTDALAHLAAEMVRDELLEAVAGRLVAVPQDSARASSAPPIQRDEAIIDWARPSQQIDRQVRAFAPAPGAFCWAGERRLKVLEARPCDTGPSGPPGQILPGSPALVVACGSGALELLRVQLEGGRPLSGRDLLNGRVIRPGQQLTSAPGQAGARA